MVELATIARPYAEAAYQVAKASNLQQWSDWLEAWSAVASNKDIKMLVDNPKIT
ncbi:MAG: F0F1 ATP synthase subunit delta, partial [Limnobacter sp.]|nr:F0F1 ATP synthase subunit delta [Limnobacter sp.]